ncbi:MAG: 4Fe-4S binding protein [Gemmatimonadota bacterium]|nr:4Fe-4S binding protein [Gemmatimonadota bacterium]
MALPEPLNVFPGDPVREVCPTKAITWNSSIDAPEIDADSCIGCGLCVARCPYGALSLTSEGIATIEIDDPDDLTVRHATVLHSTTHQKSIRTGHIGSMRSPALIQMPDSIANLSHNDGNRYVRNLLLECGIKCRTRRTGDTNIRMDGVLATTNGRTGVLEIELGYDVLETPRQLLDDIAVLSGRYGFKVEKIDAVSVITQMPAVRSEYYQVIEDIETVLNLRCRTVTVGALLALLWQFVRISGFVDDLFMVSSNNTNIVPNLEIHLPGSISNPPYPGSFSPIR